MQLIIRGSGDEILPPLQAWVRQRLLEGVKLIAFIGLPRAGKTQLMGKTAPADAVAIDLDDYLARPVPAEIGWSERVKQQGGYAAVERALAGGATVLTAGLMSSLEEIECRGVEARLIYVKALNLLPSGEPVWSVGDFEHLRKYEGEIPPRPPFVTSVLTAHERDRPWETADVVVERIKRKGE